MRTLIFILVVSICTLNGTAISHEKETPAVLCYHSVSDTAETEYEDMFVKEADFVKQLEWLCANGYRFLFADEYDAVPGKNVILTFDDGYEDNYRKVFPLLKKYGAKATIFVITDNIGRSGYLTEMQIREMYESGLVQFGSHTATHRNMAELDQKQLKEEFFKSSQRLFEITGCRPQTMTWPFGLFSGTSVSEARFYFQRAFTTEFDKGDSTYAVPRRGIKRNTDFQEFTSIVSRNSCN